MSVREWLVRTLSQRDNIPQTIIASVVAHQYDEASTAMNDNNSIEISGFGKFYFNERRAEKEMVKLLSRKKDTEQVLSDKEISDKKRYSYTRRLDNIDKLIELLKTKS
jgi:DNA-directed RNA polymerase specialized sigma54-like protein